MIHADGTVEWIPPPLLDTGQARTNIYHHPEHITDDTRPGPAEPKPDG